MMARQAGLLVVIESPYAGNIPLHVNYARACIRDSLSRGESPLASHLLYTQPNILRDEVPEERTRGINAGIDWSLKADLRVFYMDFGMSSGMKKAQELYDELGLSYVDRFLNPEVMSSLGSTRVLWSTAMGGEEA